MIDELFDVGFKIARQVVVFQQNAVLERLMPAFDLALCLRMVGSAANVPHVLCIQPLSQPGTPWTKRNRGPSAMPSRRHNSAMLDSPRKPSSTMRKRPREDLQTA